MRPKYLAWKVSLSTFFLFSCATGVILAYEYGPPPGMTGDLGDQNCTQCHLGNQPNVAGGALTLTGVPAKYSPGETYTITVALSKPGQSRWGFELAVRTVSSHQQAGTLVITDPASTQIQKEGAVQFIQQTTAGSFARATKGSWTFQWIAPSQPVGDIHFSCAGNAANNDNSNFGDFIYTTFSASSPALAADQATYFAQAVVGGGYSTDIKLINYGSAAASGNLIFTDQGGSPLTVRFSQSGDTSAGTTGSTFPVSVPPGGTQFITAGSLDASARSGWARVESSGGTIGGVSTFQFAPGGALQTVAGVLGSQLVTTATIPVDNDNGQQRYTGFAVANPGNDPVSIRIVIVDPGGNPLETLTPPELNPLNPHSQSARFLHQFSSKYLTFRGSVVLAGQAGQPFSAVALIQAQGGSGLLFTTIPVIPQKAPNIP